ncbi:hypothetical protein [uncultured Umboniibacter sp.]|uniref:hypothetical protein n=1 Tax=uncultured Umboniibacter sp. TaxID=1798917 RepID=UPI00262EF0A8|nr:hypothetical protein [uncultured Umboniibacter sp.]
MRKLILHIGSGKTGSSSIQRFYSKQKTSDFSFLYDMNGRQAIKDIEAFKSRLIRQNTNLLIYSNEWLYAIDQSDIRAIFQSLKGEFDIEVYIYLRRQEEFAISAYQQRIRGKVVSGVNRSTFGPISLPESLPKERLNYYSIVCKWAEVFGREKIKINVYDRDLFDDGCVVKDFGRKIGIVRNIGNTTEKNKTPGMITTKIGHLCNEVGVPKDLRKEIVFGAPESPSGLPSKADAHAFYAEFEMSNKQLMDEFNVDSPYSGLFHDRWDRYPDSRTDLWTEESANKAIEHLLKIIIKQSSNTHE